MSLTHAFKWSFLSEIASRLVQPLVFVVLARLLTPVDYGVVAAAAMVISFSSVFWDAGMSKALIQYQGSRAEAADAAFWINILLGCAVAVLLVLVSGPVARLIFHDARVGLVLKVMSLQVLLSASAAVHSALLQKDMRFKRLFWIRVTTVGVPGLISIPLAWNGFGYWALILGTLGGQAAQVLFLWVSSPWKPRATLDLAVARKLVRFGGWVAFTGLLFWFYSWADSLIVGMYLGAHELGLYRTGNAFTIMIYGTLFGPLAQVLYSHFSSIQNDKARVRGILLSVVRMTTFISVPLGLLLFANAPFISNLVFGAKWSGIEHVLAVLALAQALSWITAADGEAYRAVGAPDWETKIAASTLVFYLVGYWLSIRHGFEAFVWTRLLLVVGATSVHLWVANKVVGLPIGRSLRYFAVVSAICAPIAFAVLALRPYRAPWQGALALAVSAALMAAGLWALERKGLIPDLWNRIRKERFA
jgi:PST family polysaccharide transporter